jgi:hypothetical protein
MGLLSRLRGVAAPEEQLEELGQALGTVERLRVLLYLNEKRLADTFVQRRDNVTQVMKGGRSGIEISGGYAGVIAAKGSRTSTATQTIEITPLRQGLLLEDAERERGDLVDLSDSEPEPGRLLFFVGNGHIFGPWEPVSERKEPPAIDASAAARLESFRQRQVSRMRSSDPEFPGSLLWYAHGLVPLVSIGSMRATHGGTLASYADFPPFGILALLEGRSEGFTFLAPLMIWHDAAGEG